MADPDPTSIAGKAFPLRGEFDHVVVGGGEAGIAAARAAAATGARTLLVDEHPLDPGLFGLDIPYLFGARFDAAILNAARMEERVVAARPALMVAMEERVEVALGTAAMGFLYGCGYTKTVMVINMLRLFVFRIPPLWYIQHYTGMGSEGAGLAMLISNDLYGVTTLVVAAVVVRKMRVKWLAPHGR